MQKKKKILGFSPDFTFLFSAPHGKIQQSLYLLLLLLLLLFFIIIIIFVIWFLFQFDEDFVIHSLVLFCSLMIIDTKTRHHMVLV